MFLKLADLKRLMKEAYKGIGLTVGALESDDEGIFIGGNNWAVWMLNDVIHKKALAAVMELTGEIPKPGEVFRATKAGNQYEISDNDWWKLSDAFEMADVQYKVTDIVFNPKYKELRMLQKVADLSKVFIENRFPAMVDPEEMDQLYGETKIEGPVTKPSSKIAYWGNNTCILMAMLTDSQNQEKELILLDVLAKENL